MLLLLIILDLFWSVSAWIYDWSKLITIPPYLWPFVAVCPVYPLLLALVLLQLYRKKTPNQFLLAFAAIPSAVFGILAVFFYPIAMIYQGFSWNAVGQIFWVLFYGAQGFYLIKKFKISRRVFNLVVGLVALKIVVIDFYMQSYGYFDFENIPRIVMVLILILSFLFFSILLDVLMRKR